MKTFKLICNRQLNQLYINIIQSYYIMSSKFHSNHYCNITSSDVWIMDVGSCTVKIAITMMLVITMKKTLCSMIVLSIERAVQARRRTTGTNFKNYRRVKLADTHVSESSNLQTKVATIYISNYINSIMWMQSS